MRSIPYVAAAVALAASVFGCATITKSSSQSVTVNTRPVGATCTLVREENTVAVVNPTPGTVSVEKDKDAITVTCTKPGYLDSEGEIASEFEAMTFGNILFGGLIGVAVDAASGAMHDYPPLVTITLIPQAFSSYAERDQFFDQMRNEFLDQAAKTIERIDRQCRGEDCDRQIEAAEQAKEAKLREIEEKRRQALVGITLPDDELANE